MITVPTNTSELPKPNFRTVQPTDELTVGYVIEYLSKEGDVHRSIYTVGVTTSEVMQALDPKDRKPGCALFMMTFNDMVTERLKRDRPDVLWYTLAFLKIYTRAGNPIAAEHVKTDFELKTSHPRHDSHSTAKVFKPIKANTQSLKSLGFSSEAFDAFWESRVGEGKERTDEEVRPALKKMHHLMTLMEKTPIMVYRVAQESYHSFGVFVDKNNRHGVIVNQYGLNPVISDYNYSSDCDCIKEMVAKVIDIMDNGALLHSVYISADHVDEVAGEMNDALGKQAKAEDASPAYSMDPKKLIESLKKKKAPKAKKSAKSKTSNTTKG